MDHIDLNLFNAWRDIRALCERDPEEALRRFRRSRNELCMRPLRAMCLCLRASDTRIHEGSAIFELDRSITLGLDQSIADAVRRGAEHTVMLDGETIKRLLEPVFIPWPGVPQVEAAARLGISDRSLHQWMKKNAGTVRLVQHVNARSIGKRGKPVPMVYTPGAVDPNSPQGFPPDGVFGSLWQTQHEHVPDHYELRARRVPQRRFFSDGFKQLGWSWVCPGRTARVGSVMGTEDGGFMLRSPGDEVMIKPCGRITRYLFMPVPVWTVGRAMGFTDGMMMPETSGLRGEWEAGSGGPGDEGADGLRSFACKHCWRVQNVTMTASRGWNQAVSHWSGGLLQGHEVPRPMQEAPETRRRDFVAKPQEKHQRKREAIIDLMMQGLERVEIARQLKMALHNVDSHTKVIYREHGVHSRAELAAKLGRTLERPRRVDPRIEQRRKRVWALRKRGKSLRTIASELKINLKTAHSDVRALERQRATLAGMAAEQPTPTLRLVR